METKFATGLQKGDDSFAVGKRAAEIAFEKFGADRIDFCMVFCSSKYDYGQVLAGISEITKDAQVIGCSSAGEFTEEFVENNSVALALVSSDNIKFYTGIGKGLQEDETKCIEQAKSGFPETTEGYPNKSIINLHDGLAGKGEEIALCSSLLFGDNFRLAGGSAGDDLKLEKTHVFLNSTVATNAITMAMLASKQPITISVSHGHVPISDKFIITKSEGNIVYEIDNKPAYEVWKESIREEAQKNLDINVDDVKDASEELATLMTRHEFGLDTGKGYKIRWPGPTKITSGPITFACAMPEGSTVKIMGSPKEAQIKASERAAQMALDIAGDTELAGAFVFECVVRAIILGEDLKIAINSIYKKINVPILGFETYGELAMLEGQMSGFHNTTTVLMLIPK